MTENKTNLTDTQIQSYRSEIVSNDHFHKLLGMVLGLIITGLALAYMITGKMQLLIGVIGLAISLVGTILRLDTMVHRMGGFLEYCNEAWELYRKGLLFDKLWLIIADVGTLLPIAASVIYAYIELYDHASKENYMWLYLTSIATLLSLIMCWIAAPIMVRKHK